MDSWYALMVATGKEGDVATRLLRNGIRAIAPAVSRAERKDGQWTIVTRRAIPGYVFVRCVMTTALYYHLTGKPGVIRLLGRQGAHYAEIPADQAHWIEALHLACGRTSEPSRGVAGENGTVLILDGPLLALQDKIRKIDARRRRATIALELYDETYEIDLAIDIEKHPENTEG